MSSNINELSVSNLVCLIEKSVIDLLQPRTVVRAARPRPKPTVNRITLPNYLPPTGYRVPLNRRNTQLPQLGHNSQVPIRPSLKSSNNPV
jgi:hypothetical protein